MRLSALFRDLPVHVLARGERNPLVFALTSSAVSASAETLFIASQECTEEDIRTAYDKGCRAFLMETPLALENACVLLAQAPIAQIAYRVAARFYGWDLSSLRVVAVAGFRGKTTTALLIRSALTKCGIRADYTGPLERIFSGRKERVQTYPPSIPSIVADLVRMQKSGTEVAVLDLARGSEDLLLSGIPIDVLVMTAGTPMPPLACTPRTVICECRAHLHTERILSSKSGALEARSVRSGISQGELFSTLYARGTWIDACFSVKTVGKHNIRNALLAMQVLHHFGLKTEAIVSALRSVAVPGKWSPFFRTIVTHLF